MKQMKVFQQFLIVTCTYQLTVIFEYGADERLEVFRLEEGTPGAARQQVKYSLLLPDVQ